MVAANRALFGIPSGIINFFIGYKLLGMYLVSYTFFWVCSFLTDFIVLGFFLLLIPETMPDTLRRPLDLWDLNPFVYYWRAIKITMKYPLLMGILPCIFIGSFAGAGMGAVAVNQLWVGVLKFTQPEGLVPQLIGLICGIPVRPLARACAAGRCRLPIRCHPHPAFAAGEYHRRHRDPPHWCVAGNLLRQLCRHCPRASHDPVAHLVAESAPPRR